MWCIYSPLNPNDSIDRLHSLVEQVNAKLILVNQISYSHLNQQNLSRSLLNINGILNCSDSLNDIDKEKLSKVKVRVDSYLLCCIYIRINWCSQRCSIASSKFDELF